MACLHRHCLKTVVLDHLQLSESQSEALQRNGSASQEQWEVVLVEPTMVGIEWKELVEGLKVGAVGGSPHHPPDVAGAYRQWRGSDENFSVAISRHRQAETHK